MGGDGGGGEGEEDEERERVEDFHGWVVIVLWKMVMRGRR